MSGPRRKLPTRRPHLVRGFDHGNLSLHVGIGLYPDGSAGEAFISSGAKAGSDIAALLDDAGILISLLLQHGVAPGYIAGVLGKTGTGARTSPIGAAVDELVAVPGKPLPGGEATG